MEEDKKYENAVTSYIKTVQDHDLPRYSFFKKHWLGAVLGVCLVVTGGSLYFAYSAYKSFSTVTERVAAHDQALQQIITFLNQAVQPK